MDQRKVVTHGKGRTREAETPRAARKHTLISRGLPGVRKRRRVCIVSADQARILEHWGVDSECGAAGGHAHLSRTRAEMLQRDGALRFLGPSGNVATWAEARYLAVVPSGPVTTVQLVTGRRRA